MSRVTTKGSLIHQAIRIVEQIPEFNYDNFEEFGVAFDAQTPPISKPHYQ